MNRCRFLACLATFLSLPLFCSLPHGAAEGGITLDTPTSPPTWALLERELLRANEAACLEFYDRYFDERGFLLCVERWGGNDGPDDAIENCNDWPLLHALGASDSVRQRYRKAWEGHLRQYTLAKTTKVPMSLDGMYYKEFPTQMDWLHNAEGLTVFNVMGLSDPQDPAVIRRTRRYAGFYLNEDPGAPNYDPQRKIIRSMFNGSRGPLLRKATALDWAGDPIEVENRFKAGHGEHNYAQFLEHFKDYNDIIGDHPLNLLSTSVAMNAYMLTGERKYRQWVLEYVDAWRQRMRDNNEIIPTNIGLDGKIGGATSGKWYGGVYGWAFSVKVPQDGRTDHRNQHQAGFVGLQNAYLLTGNDDYLDAWRRQTDALNRLGKMENGQMVYPRMHGDRGWYHYLPGKYNTWANEIQYLSQNSTDRERAPSTGWLQWLDGKNPGYPEAALRGDLGRVRQTVAAMRQDTTTPDTRLADDPMRYNPASTNALIELTLGGIHPGHRGALLHSRLRYFDPQQRRAGLPPDTAALVEKATANSVTVTLVNTDQLVPRTVTVQAGAYAEHRFTTARLGERDLPVNGSSFTVRLAPGAGGTLVLGQERYVSQPTLSFPWDR
jgi:hypothetical protein